MLQHAEHRFDIFSMQTLSNWLQCIQSIDFHDFFWSTYFLKVNLIKKNRCFSNYILFLKKVRKWKGDFFNVIKFLKLFSFQNGVLRVVAYTIYIHCSVHTLDLISRTHHTMFTFILLFAPFLLPRSCFTTYHVSSDYRFKWPNILPSLPPLLLD